MVFSTVLLYNFSTIVECGPS